MLIAGRWRLDEDGVSRPVVAAEISPDQGTPHAVELLVDSGADRTLDLIRAVTGGPSPPAAPLAGIGGQTTAVEVVARLAMTTDTGAVVGIRGSFAGFLDAASSDVDILGRDVLNHFDVILSSRRQQVLLLTPNHRYEVVPG